MKRWSILCFLSIFFSLNAILIEDFESGDYSFESLNENDTNSNGAIITGENSYDDSGYSLKLLGNSYKTLDISSLDFNQNLVLSVKVFSQNVGNFKCFGVSDGTNYLIYSLYGEDELDEDEFVTVYQGAKNNQVWQNFLLPIGDDWLARFEYLPNINQLIFINDASEANNYAVYFDFIEEISDTFNSIPEFNVSYREVSSNHSRKSIKFYVNFPEEVNPAEYQYFWNFGNGDYSFEQNPIYNFYLINGHEYDVLLKVFNEDDFIWKTVNLDFEAVFNSEDNLTFGFVGDIITGRNIADYGADVHLQFIKDELERFDYAVANLENPLTYSNNQHPTKSICFKGVPSDAYLLDEANIDIVTIANNHILDFMENGIVDTKTALSNAGIEYSGAGLNSYEAYQPLLISKNGTTVAFLAESDRTGQYNNYQPYLNAGFDKAGFAYMTPYYFTKQLNEVRNSADFVVAELHSGSEYSDQPLEDYDKLERKFEDEFYDEKADTPKMWDLEFRHFLIDQGADLVINHHPHRIQGIEVYNGKVIAHSLGNFLFDLSYSETFPSMILNTSLNENGFYDFKIQPIYIDDFSPKPAKGELGQHILDYIAQKSMELNTIVAVKKGEKFADIIVDTENVESNIHRYTRSNIQMEEKDGWNFSEIIKLEKKGSIYQIGNISPIGMYLVRVGREHIWWGNMEEEGATMWDSDNFDSEFFYRGSRSIIHENNMTQISDLEKPLLIPKNKDFTFLAMVNSYQKPFRIGVGLSSNRNNYSYVENSSIRNNTFGWEKVTLDFSVGDNYKYAFPYLKTYSDGESCHFDDVSLIEWSEWMPINEIVSLGQPNDYYFVQFKSLDTSVDEIMVSFNEICFYSGNSTRPQNKNNISENFNNVRVFPNPVKRSNNKGKILTFDFYSKEKVAHEIQIFNIKGQKVSRIKPQLIRKSEDFHYKAHWAGLDIKGKSVSSGIYFYKIKSAHSLHYGKFLIIK